MKSISILAREALIEYFRPIIVAWYWLKTRGKK